MSEPRYRSYSVSWAGLAVVVTGPVAEDHGHEAAKVLPISPSFNVMAVSHQDAAQRVEDILAAMLEDSAP